MGSSLSETRIKNMITGGEKGQKLARFDLVPIGPLTALAEHFGKGAEKYDDRNWEKGVDWSLSYAALMRHITAWWGGEDLDEEGNSHLAAAMWHCTVLLEYANTHPELDDRPKPKPKWGELRGLRDFVGESGIWDHQTYTPKPPTTYNDWMYDTMGRWRLNERPTPREAGFPTSTWRQR